MRKEAAPELELLKLPDVISDNMMLQADKATTIWGWAMPGDNVTVAIEGQQKSAVADSAGSWRVQLDPMPPTKSALLMTVSTANDQRKVANILIGDLWLASGQSNMSYPVNNCLRPKAEIAEAENYPELRIFMADRVIEPTLQKNTKGHWVVCSSETVGKVSGVAYFYCRELLQQTGRPQAFLNVNWGGTPIQPWLSPEALESDPAFNPLLTRKYNQEHWKPSACWRSMLAPLYPVTLRGIIWYQGEGNWFMPELYQDLFTGFINECRASFNDPVLPFRFVQLATTGSTPSTVDTNTAWPVLREAQTLTLSETNTAMVVTYDLGISGNVHYPDKQTVGDRLARVALEEEYGIGKDSHSPLFQSVELDSGRVIVKFSNNEGWTDPGTITGFVIAGEDGQFVDASARIVDAQHIEVWNDNVCEPTSVRYAWSGYPVANLFTASGLPAAPFRSTL